MSVNARGEGRAGAIAFAVIALALAAFLGMRLLHLSTEIHVEEGNAKQHSKTVPLARAGLPPNRKLVVCNNSRSEATISVVTTEYLSPLGAPVTFNSASDGWRTWKIPSGTRIAVADLGGAAWDGSAVFYSMDVEGAGTRKLISGTSDDLEGGCVDLKHSLQ